MLKSRKNILLVYPRFPQNTYWSFSHAMPFIGKKAVLPPLGLITVAAMLPKYYSLKLIDMNVEELRDKDLRWADAVFTSSMIIQKESLEAVIARANKMGKPIVAGGPLPTQHYDAIKGKVDHFIIGEAESGVLDSFLRDFENGNAKRAYARHSIRAREIERKIDEKELENIVNFFGDNAEILKAESRPLMSSSPIPRYDLLKINEYSSMALQMSRGCPGVCDFCSESALFGHEPRLKPAEKVVKELEAIYELGFRGDVFFVDDNFIGNIKKVKEVLPGIINFQKKYNYPFGLYTEASIKLAEDNELMGMMREAGFNMVFVGLESPDKEVLASMNKHQNLKMDLVKAIKIIQSYGMKVTAGIIVGSDSDPDDICDKIFDLCQEAGIPTAMVSLLNAMKGSELYERLRQEGRLRKETYGNNTHEFSLNFDPLPGKDEKKIIEDYKNLQARLFDKDGKNYLSRYKVMQENLGPNPKPARRVGISGIRALAMSLSILPFSSYGRNCLKSIASTLIYHRKIFEGSVANAIMGRHLIKITHTSLKADSFAAHLHEKYDDFMTRAGEAYEKGLINSQEWYQNFCKEKDDFLAKAKKKIDGFPPDYRPRLIEAYQHITNNLDNLISKRAF
jgi:radical SAM superfamily enzyme YgiQ (UPF0313 family)